MARKKMQLSKFGAVLRAKPDQLHKDALNGIRKAGARLVVLVEHEIRNASPYPLVDRGRLVQDTSLTLTPDGCTVRNNAPYAPVMEYGARPFSPPVQPLIDWATRKGFADPVGAAWAIRQTFIKKGIKPRRFFAKALAVWKASDTLPQAVKDALARKPA